MPYKPEGYDYGPERAAELAALQATNDGVIAQADADGYVRASNDHRAQDVNGVDENGQEIGFSVGYDESYTDHIGSTPPNSADATTAVDARGRETGFRRGYKWASNTHRTGTVNNTDLRGLETGYSLGYKAARNFHTSAITSGNDLTGAYRGYANGHGTGFIAGRLDGFNDAAAQFRQPHFVARLSSDFVAQQGDVIYTLPFTDVQSSLDVTRSGSTFTINSSGTWAFQFLCSWAIEGTHDAGGNFINNHTKAYIYEGSSTIRSIGVSRRRTTPAWFGSIAAGWIGSVSAGDQFTARIEFDNNQSTSMRVFRTATSLSNVPIPANGSDRGGIGTFGPSVVFVGIKL